VTDEWIAWVEQQRRSRRISQRKLGIAVGVTQTAISDLLAGKFGQSRLVPKINAVLGGKPPQQRSTEQDVVDELKASIDAKWEMLDEDGRKAIRDLVELLTKYR
jgi:transcriptional regulator with XRE-family HTH domain